MNYLKIQKKLLDDFLKTGKLYCYTTENEYFITNSGARFFIIPKSEMWLDVPKMMDKRQICDAFPKVLEGIEGEDGAMSETMKNHIKNGICVKLVSEHNHTWVSKKILDGFEIKSGLHFTIPDSPLKAIKVWENENLCGVLMPVRIGDD